MVLDTSSLPQDIADVEAIRKAAEAQMGRDD